MLRTSAAAVLTSSLLFASAALADPAEDRIRALTEASAGSDWDARVKPILLANYDLDGSGAINDKIEVDGIPCGTWKSLDDAVHAGWAAGLRVIYGFEADKLWVGGEIGLDEAVRPYADAKLVGCGLLGGAAAPGPATVIMNVRPGDGGSTAWDTEVSRIILDAFDGDVSGTIDTTDEVIGVGCDVVAALDTRVREKWLRGVRVVYGFEADKIWIGHALGFNEATRSGADVLFALCLARIPALATAAPTLAPAPSLAGDTAAVIRGVPGGESSDLDANVQTVLVSNFDTKGSGGTLDTPANVMSLGCPVWWAIDDGVKQSYGYGVCRIYGFESAYPKVGRALSFDETMRPQGEAALVGCGLQE